MISKHRSSSELFPQHSEYQINIKFQTRTVELHLVIACIEVTRGITYIVVAIATPWLKIISTGQIRLDSRIYTNLRFPVSRANKLMVTILNFTQSSISGRISELFCKNVIPLLKH